MAKLSWEVEGNGSTARTTFDVNRTHGLHLVIDRMGAADGRVIAYVFSANGHKTLARVELPPRTGLGLWPLTAVSRSRR
jgi:hypothetical protein